MSSVSKLTRAYLPAGRGAINSKRSVCLYSTTSVLRASITTRPSIQEPNKKPKCFICKIFNYLIKPSIWLWLLLGIILGILSYYCWEVIYIYLQIYINKPESKLELITIIINFLNLILVWFFTLLNLPNYLNSALIFNSISTSNDDDSTIPMELTVPTELTGYTESSIDTENNNLLFSESKDKNDSNKSEGGSTGLATNSSAYVTVGQQNSQANTQQTGNNNNLTPAANLDSSSSNNNGNVETRSVNNSAIANNMVDEDEDEFIYGSSSQTQQALDNRQVPSEQSQASQAQDTQQTGNNNISTNCPKEGQRTTITDSTSAMQENNGNVSSPKESTRVRGDMGPPTSLPIRFNEDEFLYGTRPDSSQLPQFSPAYSLWLKTEGTMDLTNVSTATPNATQTQQAPTEQQPQATQALNEPTTANGIATETSVTPANMEDNIKPFSAPQAPQAPQDPQGGEVSTSTDNNAASPEDPQAPQGGEVSTNTDDNTASPQDSSKIEIVVTAPQEAVKDQSESVHLTEQIINKADTELAAGLGNKSTPDMKKHFEESVRLSHEREKFLDDMYNKTDKNIPRERELANTNPNAWWNLAGYNKGVNFNKELPLYPDKANSSDIVEEVPTAPNSPTLDPADPSPSNSDNTERQSMLKREGALANIPDSNSKVVNAPNSNSDPEPQNPQASSSRETLDSNLNNSSGIRATISGFTKGFWNSKPTTDGESVPIDLSSYNKAKEEAPSPEEESENKQSNSDVEMEPWDEKAEPKGKKKSIPKK